MSPASSFTCFRSFLVFEESDCSESIIFKTGTIHVSRFLVSLCNCKSTALVCLSNTRRSVLSTAGIRKLSTFFGLLCFSFSSLNFSSYGNSLSILLTTEASFLCFLLLFFFFFFFFFRYVRPCLSFDFKILVQII